jgi:8-oxo-dGTP diphosphatase
MQKEKTSPDNIRIVKLLIRNKFEKILVLRRSESHPTYAHYPDFPGGRIEEGEDDQAALGRKLSEETGLLLTTDRAVMVSERTLPIYKDQSATYALYVLKTDFDQPRVTLNWQHDHYEWSRPEDLGGFDPPLQGCIDDARDFFLPAGDNDISWRPSF